MDCREAFENWVKNHNDAPIKWIGHSYANAYMAAQWEGFKAAWQSADLATPAPEIEGLDEAIDNANICFAQYDTFGTIHESIYCKNQSDVKLILKAARAYASQSRAEPVMYARDLDGTGSLHACSKDDPGAIAMYTAPPKGTADAN